MYPEYVNTVEVGKRIRALRLSCGFTQEALAAEVDLSASYLSHIERGIKEAGLSTIVGLAFALDTTVDYILYGDHDFPEFSSATEFKTLFHNCSPYEQYVILETAKALKRSLHTDQAF